MEESGKRDKRRSNSSSQQSLNIRFKRQQQDSSSSSFNQHDIGHKRHQRRSRYNTTTQSDNPTAPSESPTVDARPHIDVNEEDYSHSRQSTVSNGVVIKQEKEDECKVIPHTKQHSATHGMDSKQSHEEKRLKTEVIENDENPRIKLEECDDHKPSPSYSSHRHQSWSSSSSLNKTDHTHGHRENRDTGSTRKSSFNASHHERKRSSTSSKHHHSHDRHRKGSSSRKHDDTKSKEKAHRENKNTSERHEEDQKTSNSNSASDTTATISTDKASHLFTKNPFTASLSVNMPPYTYTGLKQDCDSPDTPKRRRYSTMDKKKGGRKKNSDNYKERSKSHSGCFQEHHEKNDNTSDLQLLRHHVDYNDANNRKRRYSSNGSQQSQGSPSLMEDDRYQLAIKRVKIEKVENGNENGMDSPASWPSVTNETAENIYMMDNIKRESSEHDEEEEEQAETGNYVTAGSDILDKEQAESDDEYIYLHGYDEEEGQACISYCNIDPLTTRTINQSPEVIKIGYVNELKKYNYREYDYSNTNEYLEVGSARRAGSRNSSNTIGSINANDNNYDYAYDDDDDDNNKQKYTQEHDREGGFQSSFEPSPYKDKTELIENSEEDLQDSSEHHHHSNEMLLRNEIWDNMHSSDHYNPNISGEEQSDHYTSPSSHINLKEAFNSSMTNDANEDLSTSENRQRSLDCPKPSPNLSEFLSRLSICPRSLENECHSNNTHQTPKKEENMSEKEYTRSFYESLSADSKRRSTIASSWDYNRSPDDLNLTEYNNYNMELPHVSPLAFPLRKEHRSSSLDSKPVVSSLITSLKNVQLVDECGFVRLMRHTDPPTASNEGNDNINDSFTAMKIVTPSEIVSKHRRSTDDSEPRSSIVTDHIEHSYMDENVDTKVDILVPSSLSSSAAIGESSGVFVTPQVSFTTKKKYKRRRSVASGGQIGKNRQQLSAKDDFYKKPFEYGWRRELVWRSNLDSTSKADVYFISPSGKKLRSRTDIAPLLEGDLTVDHFCFIREPQDVDPKHELVRNAKSSRRASTITPTVELPAPGVGAAVVQTPLTSSTIVMGKRVSKPKAPKGASPPPEGWTAVRALRSNNAALTQRSRSESTGGRASSALQVSNNSFNNNNTSNSINKQNLKSINVVPKTTITNGLITNTKEKSAVTVIPQPQPHPQSALFNASISTMHTVKTIKPTETTSKELQGSIVIPVAVTVADNTGSISENNRKNEEMQTLLSSIDCIKCQCRMKGVKLLSDPAGRCKHCIKRMNNIVNVKIFSSDEAVANAANIKSSQEIVVVNSKKYISIARPKEEKPKPIELAKSIQPRFQKLYDSLRQLKQKHNSSTGAASSVDAEKNTSPSNFFPRVVASDTDTVATISSAAKQVTINEDDNVTNESITTKVATAGSTTSNNTTNATGIDSNSKNVIVNINELTLNNSYLAHVAKGYESILCLMKHLMLPERTLLATTCKLFNAVYNDNRIWQSVNLRNTYILDWQKFTSFLQRQNTRVLDMRRIIQKSGHQRNEMWRSFLQNIGSVKSLNTLILPRCTSRVVDGVLEHTQELRSLTAFTISDERISLTNLKNLRGLKELRLHTTEKCNLICSLETIAVQLKQLTLLSLTNIQNLHNKNIASLWMRHLEILELGDCGKLDATDLVTVLHVMKLRRLRLEFGMNREPDNTFSVPTLLNGLQTLENLKQLELINIDVQVGFDKELSKCIHLKKLLIIPTYVLQSATTNQIIMNAVQEMSSRQLVAFTWGITLELLRVTSLYIDKSQDKRKKYDSIPVLRPVPGDIHDEVKYKYKGDTNSAAEKSAEQHVSIVSLEKVGDIVRHTLPHTKISIVKVYFANTWKQQLIE